MLYRILAGLLALAAPLVAQNASLTVLHGIPGLPEPVEVFADGNSLFTFDFPESRGPLSLPPATYFIEVRLQGNTVLSANLTLEADKDYTAAAHLQEGGGIQLSAFENDLSPLGSYRSRVIVRHLADAPAVDVIARRFFFPRRIVENLSNPNEASTEIWAGAYYVSLNAAGTNTTAFGPVRVPFRANHVYAIHAIGELGTPTFQLFVQDFDLNTPQTLTASISGTACGGAIGVSTTTPSFGQPFDVTLTGGTPDGFGFLHVGRSDSRFLWLRLPLDLTRLGATGCSLYQSTENIMPVRLDANGDATRSITIPSAMAGTFDGAYFQYSFVAPGANPLGLQLTELLSVEPNN